MIALVVCAIFVWAEPDVNIEPREGGLVGADTVVAAYDWNTGTIEDISGNNNVGTISGTVPFVPDSGTVSAHRDFPGSSDYIELSSFMAEMSLSVGTVAFWINPDFLITSGHQRIFELRATVDNLEYDFIYYHASLDDYVIQSFPGTGGTVATFRIPYATIPSATWTHVAFTYDQVAADCWVYINGVAVSNLPTVGVASGPIVHAHIAHQNAATATFDGQLDEWQYNIEVLSSNNINQLFLQGKPRHP